MPVRGIRQPILDCLYDRKEVEAVGANSATGKVSIDVENRMQAVQDAVSYVYVVVDCCLR
jgi:hypothetical protein